MDILAARDLPQALAEGSHDEQLDDPAIDLVNDEGQHYIIDGIHRIAARYKRGMPDFFTRWMKLAICPRIPEELLQSGLYKYQWGEMDVRDGKLVKR